MRFLPFLNKYSASGKKEALEAFQTYLSEDEISDSLKKLAVEISGDFYSFMFSFMRKKLKIPEYKLLVQNIIRVLYIRMYQLLKSDQNYLTKQKIYSKLYVNTIPFVHKIVFEKDDTKTFGEICEEVATHIDKEYFELIAELKDYKEQYNYAYCYSRTLLQCKLLSGLAREDLIKCLQKFLQKYYEIFIKIISVALFILGLIMIFCGALLNPSWLRSALLAVFCVLLMLNLIYVKSKVKKLAAASFYTNKDLQYRLGVDAVSLRISENLVPFADPTQRNEMLLDTSTVRVNLTDDYGYITPFVKIMEDTTLQDNTLVFFVRGKEISSLQYYPDMIVAKEAVLKLAGIDIKGLKKAVNNFSDGKLFWVKKSYAEKLGAYNYLLYREYFKKVLTEIYFKYVDVIYSLEDAAAYMELGKMQLADFNVNPEDYYGYTDLREILAALLFEKISIKDVIFVLEKIRSYATKNLYLEEAIGKLKEDLSFEKKV